MQVNCAAESAVGVRLDYSRESSAGKGYLMFNTSVPLHRKKPEESVDIVIVFRIQDWRFTVGPASWE
jgi:hypothetical protein